MMSMMILKTAIRLKEPTTILKTVAKSHIEQAMTGYPAAV